MKLRWSLPAVEYIEDKDMRRIMVSVRDNLNDMVGNLLSKKDLMDAGVIKVDANGKYSLVTKSSTSTSSSAAGTSKVVYTSCVFSIVAGSVTLSLMVPQSSRVMRCWYEVTTPFTGTAGTTLGLILRFDGTNICNLVNPQTLANGWSLGLFEGVQDGRTITFSDKTTTNVAIEYTAPVGSVISGRATIFIQYATIT